MKKLSISHVFLCMLTIFNQTNHLAGGTEEDKKTIIEKYIDPVINALSSYNATASLPQEIKNESYLLKPITETLRSESPANIILNYLEDIKNTAAQSFPSINNFEEKEESISTKTNEKFYFYKTKTSFTQETTLSFRSNILQNPDFLIRFKKNTKKDAPEGSIVIEYISYSFEKKEVDKTVYFEIEDNLEQIITSKKTRKIVDKKKGSSKAFYPTIIFLAGSEASKKQINDDYIQRALNVVEGYMQTQNENNKSYLFLPIKEKADSPAQKICIILKNIQSWGIRNFPSVSRFKRGVPILKISERDGLQESLSLDKLSLTYELKNRNTDVVLSTFSLQTTVNKLTQEANLDTIYYEELIESDETGDITSKVKDMLGFMIKSTKEDVTKDLYGNKIAKLYPVTFFEWLDFINIANFNIDNKKKEEEKEEKKETQEESKKKIFERYLLPLQSSINDYINNQTSQQSYLLEKNDNQMFIAKYITSVIEKMKTISKFPNSTQFEILSKPIMNKSGDFTDLLEYHYAKKSTLPHIDYYYIENMSKVLKSFKIFFHRKEDTGPILLTKIIYQEYHPTKISGDPWLTIIDTIDILGKRNFVG